jgi:dihydroxy-acid dehydratase
VFESYADMMDRIDEPDLPVEPGSVLVMRNAGPQGAPGMPEWGQLPIPKKLLAAGVRDMVRISDARMSGTSYGACVLHVSPEAYIGGNLALVANGDLIELNVPKRSLNILISEEELQSRKRRWKAPPAKFDRGYGQLYQRHITQADQGCDFDFLERTAAAIG